MSDRAYTKAQAPQKTLSGSSSKNSLLQHTFTAAFDRASRFGHDFSRVPIHPSAARVVQTKLKLNASGDVYEQEADQVAEQVMRMAEPEALPSDDEDEAKNSLLRKQSAASEANAAGESPDVPPSVHTVLNSGPGRPLDTTTRTFMERRFGYDFSQVRVHTDERGANSAWALNARAYTVGRDVIFGARQYAPGTFEGRRLLAHELTHVVQQVNSFPSMQKKDDAGKSPNTAAGWDEIVSKAKAALAHNDVEGAKKFYSQAIVIAASSVTPPDGLVKLEPKVEDIRLNLSPSPLPAMPGDITVAYTNALEVPAHENNYWHWIHFRPDALMSTQAFTESVVSHELVHVRQFQKLWNSYKANKSPDKGTWKDFAQTPDPKSFHTESRSQGPDELEAAITVLNNLRRLKPKEQETMLNILFTDYIKTSMYKPSAGEDLAVTTPMAQQQILAVFKDAEPNLQKLMGKALWRELLDVDPNAAQLKSVLMSLRPIAAKGYSDADTQMKQLLNEFFAESHLDFSKL